MQSQSRLLEDLARVASSAMGVASGMRGEIEQRLKEQFESVLSRMDLVTREEFEVVRAMAQKAREEQETLTERLAVLEAALATKAKPMPRKTRRKAPDKPAAAAPEVK
jgi:BMFP domain-containing protein YqiC